MNLDYTLVMVALGGALLGALSGFLGTFAVLRGQSLMGDTLSHASLPGIAVAFLLAGRDPLILLLGAGIAAWIGAQMVRAITTTTRIKEDAAMGIVLASFFALGIALLSYIQKRGDASQAGLDKFIFGQAAAMTVNDVLLIGIVGAAITLIVLMFWKELKLITFDPAFAAANGYPVRWLDLLLATLIAVGIVLGLQLAGVILMVGLLIAPAVAARQWVNTLGKMITLSSLLGMVAGMVGAVLSGADRGLPTGPLIIVAASILVLISIFFAPGRGVIYGWWLRRKQHGLS